MLIGLCSAYDSFLSILYDALKFATKNSNLSTKMCACIFYCGSCVSVFIMYLSCFLSMYVTMSQTFHYYTLDWILIYRSLLQCCFFFVKFVVLLNCYILFNHCESLPVTLYYQTYCTELYLMVNKSWRINGLPALVNQLTGA